MKIIKLVLSVVLLAVLGLAGIYVAENRGLVQAGTFSNLTSKLGLASQHLPQKIDTASLQNGVKTLSSQASKISSQSGAVLGTSVSIEKQDAPLSQRAFEYARYNYCQAVVKDYEARQKESK